MTDSGADAGGDTGHRFLLLLLMVLVMLSRELLSQDECLYSAVMNKPFPTRSTETGRVAKPFNTRTAALTPTPAR